MVLALVQLGYYLNQQPKRPCFEIPPLLKKKHIDFAPIQSGDGLRELSPIIQQLLSGMIQKSISAPFWEIFPGIKMQLTYQRSKSLFDPQTIQVKFELNPEIIWQGRGEMGRF